MRQAHLVALPHNASKNVKELRRHKFITLVSVKTVDTVLQNVQAESMILIEVNTSWQLYHSHKSYEQVTNAMTQVKMVKHGFHELASPILITQIQQQYLWHFQQPVANDFIQKSAKCLI